MRRGRHHRLKVLAATVLGGLAALVPSTVAQACHAPYLLLHPDQAAAGQAVSVVGHHFSADAGEAPVEVRFNGRGGPLLWQGRPDDKGKLRFTFVAPEADPGYFVVNAYHVDGDGQITPAHASFQIIGGGPSHGHAAAEEASSPSALATVDDRPEAFSSPATPVAQVPVGAGDEVRQAPSRGTGLPARLVLALAGVVTVGVLAARLRRRRRTIGHPPSAAHATGSGSSHGNLRTHGGDGELAANHEEPPRPVLVET